MVFYAYALVSEMDGDLYIGHTNNLEKRLHAHNSGRVFSTKKRRPFKLDYFEVFEGRKEAVDRGKFLKSGCGREFLKGNGLT